MCKSWEKINKQKKKDSFTLGPTRSLLGHRRFHQLQRQSQPAPLLLSPTEPTARLPPTIREGDLPWVRPLPMASPTQSHDLPRHERARHPAMVALPTPARVLPPPLRRPSTSPMDSMVSSPLPPHGFGSAHCRGHSSSTCILPKSDSDLDAAADWDDWDAVAVPLEALLAACVDQRAKVRQLVAY